VGFLPSLRFLKTLTDMTNSTKTSRPGGAATGGGMNFQAAVSAIAYVYMLRGQQLSWLEKVAEDVPITIDAETGGAGDDIQLRLKSGEIVEVQVKKGLQSGDQLWNPLINLAKAINNNVINYGVLIVSPTSSKTIRENLAKDIERLGNGRGDNLSDIATKLVNKLKGLNLPISCSCIRIQTINALAENQDGIRLARSELTHLCADQTQINLAWNTLYKDASILIEQRGRRDVSSVLRLLHTEGIKLAENKLTAPMLLLKKLSDWTFETHATFSIFGVQKKLPTDKAWIPLHAVVQDQAKIKTEDLADALKKYQTWESRSFDRDAIKVDPETLARFVTRVILIGGPGMGKTTLLKRIARRYSEERIPVLHVKLIKVMQRMMQAGSSFEEAIFDLGLDGSGITSAEARQSAFPNWLLLCDGLDECGRQQEEVAAGVARFVAGHSDCRVLVTTRPVGYDTAHFSDWRHYYLAPLESSSASTYLATLVSASAPEGSLLPDNKLAYNVCSAELKQDKTHKIVARTPLLLGLAASIIVRGGHLGVSKERLFEQIFDLIDDAPNARIPEPPAAVVLLQRYLDMLGWHITAQPLNRIDRTLERCAEDIIRETGNLPLKDRADAETYLCYWQDVGMIERIGHGYDETLSFIHKSFGEFAAARHLGSMSSEEQRTTIINIIDAVEWAEVIRFAALLGLADIIGEVLISNEMVNSKNVKRISLAIELVAAANPSPKPALREKIINEAFRVVCSNRRLQAFEVGKQLLAGSRRFPEEIGPLARKLLNHKQPWTYSIAWAIAVTAGTDYYPVDNLAEALQTSIDIIGPSIRSSLGGGIILGQDNEHELLESFTLNVLLVLLEQPPSELTDSIILYAIENSLNTIGFWIKAQELLLSKGKTNIVKKLNEKDNYPNFLEPPEGYRKAEWIAYEAIFDALEAHEIAVKDDSQPKSLLHFSAFLEASHFGKMPVSDIWAWTQPFDKAATRETFKGLIALSGIDLELLRSEAQQAKAYLRTSPNSLYKIITDVDPPKINWNKANSLDLDNKLIENALFHPSRWIVWIAANLIENMLSPPELKLLIQRLFKNGNGHTLRAACGIAAELKQEQSLKLVFERLSNPLVHGCEYLFKLLPDFNLQWGDELSDVLVTGLKGEVKIAVEAAQLAANIAKPGQVDLANLITEAFDYWLEHEKPYPTKGGVIPLSPRAKLLETLFKIRPPSYIELKQYTADSRSDVKDIAKDKLINWLGSPDSPRLQILNDIDIEELAPHILGKALKAMVPLSSEELALWERLLSSNNPEIRFGAMSLLHQDYLDPAGIKNYAQAMTKDDEQQIREQAYRILDGLNTSHIEGTTASRSFLE